MALLFRGVNNSTLVFARSEKERDHANLENDVTAANKRLQQAETTLSNLQAELKSKREELKGNPHRMESGMFISSL
jgi:predicted  nucleic acid-binding Zn-ribbon protein